MPPDPSEQLLRQRIEDGRRAEDELLALLRARWTACEKVVATSTWDGSDPTEGRRNAEAARDALAEALSQRTRRGGKEAKNLLIQVAQPQLRALAARLMRHERPDHTWQPTVVFDDEFLYLHKEVETEWQDMKSLIGFAKLRMEHRLIDHSREAKLPIEPAGDAHDQPADEPEQQVDGPTSQGIFRALAKLKAEHPRRYEVFVLHRPLRLTYEQIGELLGYGDRQARRDFDGAEMFLNAEIRRFEGE
jgi:RNA polymerase sigma-70 factor, ECF subfamily